MASLSQRYAATRVNEDSKSLSPVVVKILDEGLPVGLNNEDCMCVHL